MQHQDTSVLVPKGPIYFGTKSYGSDVSWVRPCIHYTNADPSQQLSVDAELHQTMSRLTSDQQPGVSDGYRHWVDIINVLACPRILCAHGPH